jgi:hypothetical protein
MRPFLYSAALLILPVLTLGAAREELLVIVNSSVSARAISSGDLREVFLGERHALGDGSKVNPVLLKDGPTHDAFLSAYIGKSEAAFRAGWLRLVFTGKGTLPHTFDSETALLDYIAATPGAIGYVRSAGTRPNVKVLAVK